MNTEKTKELIRGHESIRLKVYKDTVGVTTIGYGRNLEDRGITVLEAEAMLDSDFDQAVIDAAQVLGLHGWVEMNDARRAVLVDMAFNLGRTRLSAFERALQWMRAGDFAQAAEEMLDSKWARQVGSRATGLAEMMRTGEWD